MADCQTGDILADISAEAENRDGVIHALGEAGTRLRTSLGDPTASQAEFNQPLERGHDFLAGCPARVWPRLGSSQADKLVPHLKRAAELDPNFALVLPATGPALQGSWQSDLAPESFTEGIRIARSI